VEAIQAIAANIVELRSITVFVIARREDQGSVTEKIVRSVTKVAHGTQALTTILAAVTAAAGKTGIPPYQIHFAARDCSASWNICPKAWQTT